MRSALACHALHEIRRSGDQEPSQKFSWSPGLLVSCLLCLCLSVAATTAAEAGQGKKSQPAANKAAAVNIEAVQTQVMLDRAGYSPGEIDGSIGTSTRRALAAFTKSGGTADALPADAITTYKITAEDAAGPYVPDIPADMEEKAKLESLGYKNILEALGERFHASPNLLKRMNPTATFAAGDEIAVPNVLDAAQPGDSPRGGDSDAGSPTSPAGTTVTVRKSTSDVTVTDGSGRTLMYAPVTTGSENDPLPLGEWKVNGVQKNPTFRYNPKLFWDADPTHSKALIPAGPNNPVGVVWVDISKPHYGLHGTPEPATVGKTSSHGCVRLTNWDALKLASLVKPGTKVVFAE